MTIRINTNNNRLVNGIVSLCHAFGVNDVVVEGKKKHLNTAEEDAEDADDLRVLAERANEPSRSFAEFAAELKSKHAMQANEL